MHIEGKEVRAKRLIAANKLLTGLANVVSRSDWSMTSVFNSLYDFSIHC